MSHDSSFRRVGSVGKFEASKAAERTKRELASLASVSQTLERFDEKH